MANANKGIFTGRIARKEVRRNDKATIANLSLAVNYYDRKEEKEASLFVKAAVFNKMAENLEKLADVGDLIYLEGEWRPNNWTSKKSGEKHNELRLSVTNWELLRKKGERGDHPAAGTSSAGGLGKSSDAPALQDGFYPMDEELEDDDLPF